MAAPRRKSRSGDGAPVPQREKIVVTGIAGRLGRPSRELLEGDAVSSKEFADRRICHLLHPRHDIPAHEMIGLEERGPLGEVACVEQLGRVVPLVARPIRGHQRPSGALVRLVSRGVGWVVALRIMEEKAGELIPIQDLE